MEKEAFQKHLQLEGNKLAQIRELAHGVHDGVNQKYDKSHPYWFHLDMVADFVTRHAHEVCDNAQDILPIMFGAYFHDSIEDARLTYNDVLSLARNFFDAERAVMATEIVYALTNEKGRTRAERANDRYYEGICLTPYAPMVKLADRLANYTYSSRDENCANRAMHQVYAQEMPHFISAITAPSSDLRLILPPSMLAELASIS